MYPFFFARLWQSREFFFRRMAAGSRKRSHQNQLSTECERTPHWTLTRKVSRIRKLENTNSGLARGPNFRHPSRLGMPDWPAKPPSKGFPTRVLGSSRVDPQGAHTAPPRSGPLRNLAPTLPGRKGRKRNQNEKHQICFYRVRESGGHIFLSFFSGPNMSGTQNGSNKLADLAYDSELKVRHFLNLVEKRTS